GLRPHFQFAVFIGNADDFDVFPAMHPGQTLFAAVGLEPGVDDCAVGCRHAHHRRQHEETVPELGVEPSLLAADPRIFGIHEDVRARLQLVPNAARAFKRESAGSRAADYLADDAVALERVDGGAHRTCRVRYRALALREARQVLCGAVIGLQAAESQPRGVGNRTREIACAVAGGNAAALHTDLDLDQPAERDAELGRRARCGVDLLFRIETKRDGGIRSQRRQPAKLRRADDFVADHNVAHTAAHQSLGLADLLATLSDGTGSDLL